MTDFLIVGRGLAASVLMHTFKKHSISFTAIGNQHLSSCSSVAAGIWNPIVFKRLTKSWLADDLISFLLPFYSDCESEMETSFVKLRAIVKPFTEEQERMLWLRKSETELLNFIKSPMDEQITAEISQCKVPNGYGTVNQAGNINVKLFIESSAAFFSKHIYDDVFDHNLLKIYSDRVCYKYFEFKNIIFCEGFLVKDNPFFNWIPLKPAKGEILTIKMQNFRLKETIFNKNGFILNTGEDEYKAGATYAWDDLSQEPTKRRMNELRLKINQMTDHSYRVVSHEAGIRPSSVDRRPIIGAHPTYSSLFVFNGLGTKGVMLAPYFANNFVNFYLKKEPLNESVHVKRFYHLYGKKEN